ncbi:MAG: hypothetical protein AAF921_19840 [Cyanobacteria bacterium P01_D01_bin.44]
MSNQSHRRWLILSLLFAILYGVLFWRIASEDYYSLQDDARQHIFWMQRWLDPTLFPNDLMADYFQSLSPFGYRTLYRVATALGIHPFLFSKLLPPILGIVSTIYGFYLCLRLIPSPVVAFASTLILNQSMWMWQDLGSGTPRAFAIPLLLAFLYYLSKRALWPSVSVVILSGWFYPHLVLISVATLAMRLLRWGHRRIELSADPLDYHLLAWGGIAGLLVLLPFMISTSPYGPVVTAAQAKTMPEFVTGGRHSFFGRPWLDYWLGTRSGLFPVLNPAPIFAGFLLPVLLLFREQVPLLLQTTRELGLLLQFMVGSLGTFLLAHIMLFRLHSPNRYTHYSARIILSIATAMVLISLAAALGQWLAAVIPFRQLSKRLSKLAVGTVLMGLMLYPASLNNFLDILYASSDRRPLYEFLAQQPKDTLVASLSKEANNISSFVGRSVLVSPEHSIAYHTGYYTQIRQRVFDLIRAQYSTDLGELQKVTHQYGIDFWLIDSNSFDLESLDNNRWLRQFQPEMSDAIARLKQGQQPILKQLIPACTTLRETFKQREVVLVDATCLLSK